MAPNQPRPLETPADDGLIREALVRRLALRYRKEPEVAIINEFGLCQHRARVDLLVVTGQLHGFEIKSDLDDASRLANQIRVYGQVLHRVTLVAAPRALAHAATRVPDWWALWEARRKEGKVRIFPQRRGRTNAHRSMRAVAEILWRNEVLELLRRHGHGRGVISAARPKLWDRASQVLAAKTIDDEVVRVLGTRRYNRPWGGSRKVDPAAVLKPVKKRRA